MIDTPAPTSSTPPLVRSIIKAQLAIFSSFVSSTLRWDDQGHILPVEPNAYYVPKENEQALDGTGCTVLPGFIDVHIHGSAGVDVMDAQPENLDVMSSFLARHGVTSFYPTTMTAAPGPTLAAVNAIATRLASQKPLPGARVLGIHVEGPFISPDYPGAQHPDNIRLPDLAEFDRLVAAGPVKLITLAPEVPGGMDLIARAEEQGVRAVLGHTAATFAQAQAAVDAGVSQVTHTFNAMTGLHHRRPGVVGATLSEDRLFAQLIADTVHVHPAAIDILFRCKGAERILLITDAIRAAGLPEGEYELGGQPVFVADGACRLADGTLAGSILTMDRALANLAEATGKSLGQIWPASSLAPAQAMGLAHTVGKLDTGLWADLVMLDEELAVVATIVGGEVVYLRDEWRLGYAQPT